MDCRLGVMLAFMEQGKSAVITGERFERKAGGFYLRKVNKPDNFDARLQAVLEREQALIDIYAEHAEK